MESAGGWGHWLVNPCSWVERRRGISLDNPLTFCVVLCPYKPLTVWIQVLATPSLRNAMHYGDRLSCVSARWNSVGKETVYGVLGAGGEGKGSGEVGGKQSRGGFWGIRAPRGPCDMDTRRVWRDERTALSMQTQVFPPVHCIYPSFFPSLPYPSQLKQGGRDGVLVLLLRFSLPW